MAGIARIGSVAGVGVVGKEGGQCECDCSSGGAVSWAKGARGGREGSRRARRTAWTFGGREGSVTWSVFKSRLAERAERERGRTRELFESCDANFGAVLENHAGDEEAA